MRRQINFLELGQRLKLARKELNIQQKEMAADLKMPASYLSEIESGKGNPGPEFFMKLFSEYNISMDYLVLGIGEMFIQTGVRVKRSGFELSQGIKTIEELAWLMDASTFFKNMVLGAANKILLTDEDTVKTSISKAWGQRQMNDKEPDEDTGKRGSYK
jgi:transcriptional regulator with XRE-family HTH domain